MAASRDSYTPFFFCDLELRESHQITIFLRKLIYVSRGLESSQISRSKLTRGKRNFLIERSIGIVGYFSFTVPSPPIAEYPSTIVLAYKGRRLKEFVVKVNVEIYLCIFSLIGI